MTRWRIEGGAALQKAAALSLLGMAFLADLASTQIGKQSEILYVEIEAQNSFLFAPSPGPQGLRPRPQTWWLQEEALHGLIARFHPLIPSRSLGERTETLLSLPSNSSTCSITVWSFRSRRVVMRAPIAVWLRIRCQGLQRRGVLHSALLVRLADSCDRLCVV